MTTTRQDTGDGSDGRDGVAGQDLPAVSTETLTDEMIRSLLIEQESTSPVGPLWSTCVDALSDEWHEDDGAVARAHNRERAEARARIADAINARNGTKP